MSEKSVQDNSSKYYLKRYAGMGQAYHWGKLFELTDYYDKKILDVGCGTGILSEKYPYYDITGIDISDEMLALNPHKWIKAPCEHIPFDTDTFDVVCCRSVIHHLEDPYIGLAEIKRVLKPGGKVMFWETNKSALAQLIRRFTQHGDRFSEFHTSFKDFPSLVSNFFEIESVKYEGFVAYPLFGFPDIIDFTKFMCGKHHEIFDLATKLDRQLSNSAFKKLSFAVKVTAVENSFSQPSQL